ncbi:MAG: hypothetical protein WKG00_11955 [Polyangiaceae bacterium]
MKLAAALAASLAFSSGAALGCGASEDLPSEDPVASDTALGPGLVRAVKWKQEMASQDHARSARLETHGLTYPRAAKALLAVGVTDVVLRIPDRDLFDDAQEFARWDNELVKMLSALKEENPDVRVYLWKRQWLQTRNAQGEVVDTHGEKELASLVARVVHRAKDDGVADVLAGIAPIETNIEDAKSTRRLALKTAALVNEATGGWLEHKTFLFPGAGMGSDFRGIDEGGGKFFDEMSHEVKRFSFIYKHMTPCESGSKNCTIQNRDDAWHAHVGKSSKKPVEAQIDFLRKDMGLADLERMLDHHAAEHPALCNVVFWGDQGDGITLMSETNLAAVHAVLAEKNGWRSQVFDMAIQPPDTSPHQARKYLFDVASGDQVALNGVPWVDWGRWGSELPW